MLTSTIYATRRISFSRFSSLRLSPRSTEVLTLHSSAQSPSTRRSISVSAETRAVSQVSNSASRVFQETYSFCLFPVVAKTAAGNIPISTIPFTNIPSTFPGIDGFGGKATIPASELNSSHSKCATPADGVYLCSAPVVIGGGAGNHFAPSSGGEFLRYAYDSLILANSRKTDESRHCSSHSITLSVILDNPAPLILHTNMVSFQVIYMGALVGRAYVNPLDLYEGTRSFQLSFFPRFDCLYFLSL